MSQAYTDYLKKLDAGKRPDQELAGDVLAQLKTHLKIQVQRRGMWRLSPTLFGLLGSFWDDGALDDLVHDAYLFVFGERLKNLLSQLKQRDNVDGIVVIYLKHFLTDLQRKADPIGYRVYEVFRTSVERAVDSKDVHVLSRGERIRNDTVLGFSPAADPATATADLSAAVRGWSDDLLPHLITGRARQMSRIYGNLCRHVLALHDEGVAVFLFGDVVRPLQQDVRARWAEVWTQDDGEQAPDYRDGVLEIVRVFRPEEYDDGQSLEWLLWCIPHSIDHRQDVEQSREKLWTLWEYVRVLSLRDDPSEDGVKLPSALKLSKLLGIYRERIPVLLKILRGIAEACREREGRVEDVAAEDWQAQPALRRRDKDKDRDHEPLSDGEVTP